MSEKGCPSPFRDPSADAARALRMGREFIEGTRESNARYAEELGEPSKVSEAEYLKAEDECAVVLLKHLGYSQTAAKKLVHEARVKT